MSRFRSKLESVSVTLDRALRSRAFGLISALCVADTLSGGWLIFDRMGPVWAGVGESVPPLASWSSLWLVDAVQVLTGVAFGAHLSWVFKSRGEPYRTWWSQLNGAWWTLIGRVTAALVSTPIREGYQARAYIRMPEGQSPPVPRFSSRPTGLVAKRPWSMEIPTGAGELHAAVALARFDQSTGRYLAATSPVLDAWGFQFSEDGHEWHVGDYDPNLHAYLRYRFGIGNLTPRIRLGTGVSPDEWIGLATCNIDKGYVAPGEAHAADCAIETICLDVVRRLRVVLEWWESEEPAEAGELDTVSESVLEIAEVKGGIESPLTFLLHGASTRSSVRTPATVSITLRFESYGDVGGRFCRSVSVTHTKEGYRTRRGVVRVYWQ